MSPAPSSSHALSPEVAGRDANESAGAQRQEDSMGTHNVHDDPATINRPFATFSPDHAGLTAARDHAILAAALDPIITIDATGTIHFASDSVQRVFGWTPQELVGRNVNILMPEADRTAHDGHLADTYRTAQTHLVGSTREVQAARKSGELFPIELCVSRVEYSPQEDSPLLFVGIIRDITQRKRLERELEDYQHLLEQKVFDRTNALQQSQDKLRLADRLASIGTLAAGLGHDMNNVLLPVRARLDALAEAVRTGDIPAAQRAHIDEIRKSTAYLQQLADGLHYLAMDPDIEEDTHEGGTSTDLSQWWSQAGTLLSKAAPKHVRVIASFQTDLPKAALPAHGLAQAILNLVVNAGEAIPGPSIRKRRQGLVRIWAKPVEVSGRTWIRIGVTDNGTGMSADVQRRAFDMFYTTKSRGLGTGLGLALVRKVAERGGGRVEIQSELGNGTTVTMIIPAARSAEQARASGESLCAVVSVEDGRAAAIITHVLEISHVAVRSDNDHTRAHIWVVSPTIPIGSVRAWRIHHPDGKLVLLGSPAARAALRWKVLSPIVIYSPDDFDSIRTAIGQAIAQY